MSETLDFGKGSWEGAGPVAMSTLRQIDHDINGNGKPGLKADVAEIKTALAELKTTASVSLTWLKGIGWAIGIMFTVIGLFFAYLEVNHRISQTTDSYQVGNRPQTPSHATVSDF